MHDILGEITSQGLNRDGARAARRLKQEGKKSPPGRQKSEPYVFRYAAADGDFAVELRFKSSEVQRPQIAGALRKVLDSLESDVNAEPGNTD
jgi:hypothetical protein